MKMAINIDEHLHNADWTKSTWDLLDVNSKKALTEYLKKSGMTLAHFKKLPIYQFNKNKIPWLKGV